MADAAYLLLEDGRYFSGEAVGARGVALGEVVFNTSMTGYQEILTDPSSAGQLVALTYPLAGNYGVNTADAEAPRPWAGGLIVREIARLHSNWRAEESLEAYLRRTELVGITEVDTRALTLHIREAGAMRGAIAPASLDRDAVMERIRAQPTMLGQDMTATVTSDDAYTIEATGEERCHIVAVDFGVRAHALRQLADRGCRITVVPASSTAAAVLERDPAGLFLSSGPGDPAAVGEGVDSIRALVEQGLPVLGIGLGHQLLARAFGATTERLPHGHRGANHPVWCLDDGTVEITSQNHGFAVRGGTDRGIEGATALRSTHVNLNDGTIEGLAHREFPAFGIQYYPKAVSGARGESTGAIDRFVREVTQS